VVDVVFLSVIFISVSLACAGTPFFIQKKVSARELETLTGIASGFLLVSAILVVLPEGFHIATMGKNGEESFSHPPLFLGLAAFSGFCFMMLLEGIGFGHAIHEEHHDHIVGHGHGHIHHPVSGPLLTLGLSVHALADGVAIGVAAATGETSFSILVAVGVLVHRIPAALSLGLFSLHQPGGLKQASRGIVIFSLATPVALILSYIIFDGASDSFLALILLFSAGTFIYVATVDTLPAIHNPDTGRRSIRNVLGSATAYTVLLLICEAAEVFDHSHLH
jgi:zinc transporter 9